MLQKEAANATNDAAPSRMFSSFLRNSQNGETWSFLLCQAVCMDYPGASA